jgi:uncharacterized membrane protein
MNKITHGKIFLKGLAFFLPIALTVGILVWGFGTLEGLLQRPLQWLLPSALRFPGMGIILGIIAIYLLGLATHERFLGFLFSWVESLLAKLPLFSVIYENIKELTEFLSGAKDDQLERVVLVDMGNELSLIGFVTRQDSGFADNSETGNENLLAVFLPMSYQMGGYTLYLPESRLTTLEISTQEAMQRILTADISGGRAKKQKA